MQVQLRETLLLWLFKRLHVAALSVQLVWFADDATAVVKTQVLHKTSSSLGPHFGYFSNASKTVLILKSNLLTAAKSIFGNMY